MRIAQQVPTQLTLLSATQPPEVFRGGILVVDVVVRNGSTAPLGFSLSIALDGLSANSPFFFVPGGSDLPALIELPVPAAFPSGSHTVSLAVVNEQGGIDAQVSWLVQVQAPALSLVNIRQENPAIRGDIVQFRVALRNNQGFPINISIELQIGVPAQSTGVSSISIQPGVVVEVVVNVPISVSLPDGTYPVRVVVRDTGTNEVIASSVFADALTVGAQGMGVMPVLMVAGLVGVGGLVVWGLSRRRR